MSINAFPSHDVDTTISLFVSISGPEPAIVRTTFPNLLPNRSNRISHDTLLVTETYYNHMIVLDETPRHNPSSVCVTVVDEIRIISECHNRRGVLRFEKILCLLRLQDQHGTGSLTKYRA